MNTKIILLIVLVCMLIFGFGWYFLSQKKSSPAPSLQKQPTAAAPLDSTSGALQLPTVELPKTNPFEGIKLNPFE